IDEPMTDETIRQYKMTSSELSEVEEALKTKQPLKNLARLLTILHALEEKATLNQPHLICLEKEGLMPAGSASSLTTKIETLIQRVNQELNPPKAAPEKPKRPEPSSEKKTKEKPAPEETPRAEETPTAEEEAPSGTTPPPPPPPPNQTSAASKRLSDHQEILKQKRAAHGKVLGEIAAVEKEMNRFPNFAALNARNDFKLYATSALRVAQANKRKEDAKKKRDDFILRHEQVKTLFGTFINSPDKMLTLRINVDGRVEERQINKLTAKRLLETQYTQPLEDLSQQYEKFENIWRAHCRVIRENREMKHLDKPFHSYVGDYAKASVFQVRLLKNRNDAALLLKEVKALEEEEKKLKEGVKRAKKPAGPEKKGPTAKSASFDIANELNAKKINLGDIISGTAS
ncbi:MAG: hypothetical protein KDK48_06120, partial [Chlamydiia bacterium]|nr:hypothetical protein [Chlamydiia bacterium]